MSLRRRLERLGGGRPEEAREGPASPRGIPGLETREVVREEGSFLVSEAAWPAAHRHGRVALREALAARPEALRLVALDERLGGLRLDRALFLDTETTGLSGGAGTYVFLVGAGWFEGDVFHLRQYFMRDHREERAMLAALDEQLARFEGLVTFHGKSFDGPRLSDRMRALHLEPRLPALPHLDLCQVGRRLWRGKHPDGRLQTLEAEECGFLREDDLPGAECPAAWFAYLRGDGRLVARVFEHNRDDILSLVALAARVARVGEGRAEERERLVRARLLLRAGRAGEAEEDLRALLAGGPPSWVVRHSLRELATLLRRRGETEEANACWAALRREDPAAVTPLVEMAKHLEHRRRDVSAALEITEEALRRAAEAPETSLRSELLRRRQRLLGKLGRPG